MRKLTHFGKRVMASLTLIVSLTVMVSAGILVCGNYADVIGMNQEACNIIFTLVVLPICSKLIVDMVCIIKDGELI